MAKITYGPPVTHPIDRPGMMRRDALGPGSMIGLTQRAAELVFPGPNAQTRQH